ncbi:hypothetical protein SAMN03080617_01752 [Algoriphagus alkaliphilus]|uniref:Uncharacterized protein n=1 Tax=Algoriphagus alkaliphilus TaxID=279824 RepID=A0A1G5XIK2_9BACT|nr:hypothetical protein SAMN03080617_01752 [Algoriphagus alkaliphilus]
MSRNLPDLAKKYPTKVKQDEFIFENRSESFGFFSSIAIEVPYFKLNSWAILAF